MSVTLNITESQALTSLRTFLLSVLPSGIEIVRGQNNRVAMPDVDDFIVMQPILRERLSTNFVAYSDGMTLHPPTTVESGFYLTPTALTVQLDVYGPASGENAQIVLGLLRDGYAVYAMRVAGSPIVPLYTSDLRQVPLLNAEAQYEDRWSVDATFQFNPVVTTTQDFADQLDIELNNVEATYSAGVAL
jgi:hypothetical protein